VKRSTEVAVIEPEVDCAGQLARFFPGSAPVRVPVQVTSLRGGGAKLREATILEFGARSTRFLFQSCRWNLKTMCECNAMHAPARRLMPPLSQCNTTKDERLWPSNSSKDCAIG